MNNYRKDEMGHRRQTSKMHADLCIYCTRIAAEALYRGVNVSPLSSSKVTAAQTCLLHKCHFPKSDFLESNFVYIFCDPENNILLIRQSSVNLLTCSLIIPASYSSISPLPLQSNLPLQTETFVFVTVHLWKNCCLILA